MQRMFASLMGKDKTLAQNKNTQRGFSLIELLVVVAILAILAAIAIPLFLNQKTKALNSAAQSDVRNMIPQLETVRNSSGVFSMDGTEWAALGGTTVPTKGVGMGYILNCAFTVSNGTPTFVSSPGNYVLWAYPKISGAWGNIAGTSIYFYTSLNSAWFVAPNGYATPACNGTWQNASWNGSP